MKDFTYLFEAVYETTSLSRYILNEYLDWLKNNITDFNFIPTLFDPKKNKSYKVNLEKTIKNSIGNKIKTIDITDKILILLNTFIKDNNFKTKDDIEEFKKKKFYVIFKPYINIYGELDDRKIENKEPYNYATVSSKETYQKDMSVILPSVDDTKSFIKINIKNNILYIHKEKEKTEIRRILKHELVHMLDYSRIKKTSYIGKDNLKHNTGLYKNKNIETNSNNYFLEPAEQNANIQNIVSDLMENKLNRVSFSKMVNSQDFLKRFAEKHHPGISKSNINTKENLRNWNRYVGEFMSKIRDANQKIKINFRDKGKSYTEADLIPEKFGFLTILKENRK
jgi:hypothetical protein